MLGDTLRAGHPLSSLSKCLGFRGHETQDIVSGIRKEFLC